MCIINTRLCRNLENSIYQTVEAFTVVYIVEIIISGSLAVASSVKSYTRPFDLNLLETEFTEFNHG